VFSTSAFCSVLSSALLELLLSSLDEEELEVEVDVPVVIVVLLSCETLLEGSSAVSGVSSAVLAFLAGSSVSDSPFLF